MKQRRPQPVYFSVLPDCVPYAYTVIPCNECPEVALGGCAMCDDLCPDGPPESYEVKPPHEAWHDYVIEGVAPSYAVAARMCNACLKALRDAEPITRHLHFVFHVEPYDAEAGYESR